MHDVLDVADGFIVHLFVCNRGGDVHRYCSIYPSITLEGMADNVLTSLSDWIAIRVELMANHPVRWLGTNAYYSLPTFDYYLANCVNDKGGKYDFTQRLYSTHLETIRPIKMQGFNDANGGAKRILRYSYWMGTPFNFKEEWS